MRQLSVSIPSVSDSSAGNVPSLIYNLYQLYVSDPSAHGSNAELIKVSVESVSVSGEPQSFGRYIVALRVNGNLQQPVHNGVNGTQ